MFLLIGLTVWVQANFSYSVAKILSLRFKESHLPCNAYLRNSYFNLSCEQDKSEKLTIKIKALPNKKF